MQAAFSLIGPVSTEPRERSEVNRSDGYQKLGNREPRHS
jgi:hypothetical protein